jgi:hypothetical protein
MISALAAVVSIVVSMIALYIAFAGTKTTNQIATEALKTARQANEISLGLVREPAVLEFVHSDQSRFIFDFTNPTALKEELKTIITVQNAGKKAIDAVDIEIVGINGLTQLLSNPSIEFRSLPAHSARLDFRTALQPKAIAHIDVRKYLLIYLEKVNTQLPDPTGIYSTVVNVILSPKATNESTPSPAGLSVTKNDTHVLTIKFSPVILGSTEAKAVLQGNYVAHRVYGN